MSKSPPGRGRSRTRSKSTSKRNSTSRSKSVSPLGGASSSSPAKYSNAKLEKAFLRLLTKDEDEDSKSIKISQPFQMAPSGNQLYLN